MVHPRTSVLTVALLAVALSGASPQATEARVPAAFVGFESRELAPSGLDILAELVRAEIARSPGYALVERANLASLLEEQELALSDVAEPRSAVRIGGLLGAEKLLVGRVGILGNLYIITLSMIDVSTGAVERTQTEEFVGSLEDLRKPVRIAAQRILGIEGIEVEQGEYIHVVTEPPGVGVYVNGLFEGSSPVKVRVPKAGRHTVKLAAAGYRSWTQTVNVEANATYFVNARLLKEEKPVDPRIRAMQDGRIAFVVYATVFAAASADAILYTFGSGLVDADATLDEKATFTRLAVGLPLVTAPVAFYGALRATERAPLNGGRSFMIVSSSLWGTSWGLAAAVVFGPAGFEPAFAGLSAAGGLLYGVLATVLTRGDEPFPASRAWLFNLGSVLGSFLGLGVPFLFGADAPGLIYAGMVTGSLAGSALSLYLTRNFTEGRNVENLALGSLVSASPGRVALGIPLPRIELRGAATDLLLPVLSIAY